MKDIVRDYLFTIKREDDAVAKNGDSIKMFTISRPMAWHEIYSDTNRIDRITAVQVLDTNSDDRENFAHSVNAAFLYVIGAHIHGFSDEVVGQCDRLEENKEINLVAIVKNHDLDNISLQENVAQTQNTQER